MKNTRDRRDSTAATLLQRREIGDCASPRKKSFLVQDVPGSGGAEYQINAAWRGTFRGNTMGFFRNGTAVCTQVVGKSQRQTMVWVALGHSRCAIRWAIFSKRWKRLSPSGVLISRRLLTPPYALFPTRENAYAFTSLGLCASDISFGNYFGLV